MLAAIALGSNLSSRFGDPAANLHEALRRLATLGKVLSVSSFHETEPVGYRDQPNFVNAAAVLETAREPLDLLQDLLGVERAMGRLRNATIPPKGPRVIDLDLLLYQNAPGQSVILNERDLLLPHPEMVRRGFVLLPLAEIAPDWQHPLSGKTVQQLLLALQAEDPPGSQ